MPVMNFTTRCTVEFFTILALVCAWPAASAGGDTAPGGETKKLAAGKELFTREWLPGDKRSHAGDGLGPVFNARSCVACHHQGGTGGAGPKQTNVTIVSVFVAGDLFTVTTGVTIDAVPDSATSLKQPDRAKLAEIHPALRTEGSFPLHRFGADKQFAKWKAEILGRRFAVTSAEDGLTELTAQATSSEVTQSLPLLSTLFHGAEETRKVDGAKVVLIPSQRNAPALFGAGLIDRIPARVLEEVATEQARAADAESKKNVASKAASTQPDTPSQKSIPLTGRVVRLRDGRIGRFGWKAHVATLREFTLQACANELGLEVPGFPRAAPPWKKDYKAPGLGMTAEQCDLLVGFVASLSRPARRAPETPQHAAEIAVGQQLFSSVGCAACHRPKLGDVEGIYSDLLLHDMGQALSGAGFYGTSIPVTDSADPAEPLPVNRSLGQTATKEKPPKFGAGAREWRTPPLWGIRDSAPYLHDGRAETIADAVALHGGEGLIAAQAFFRLSPREQQQVELFLQSLAAPTTPQ
jgi:CxxC motif-containing protein (DUF1111 family)